MTLKLLKIICVWGHSITCKLLALKNCLNHPWLFCDNLLSSVKLCLWYYELARIMLRKHGKTVTFSLVLNPLRHAWAVLLFKWCKCVECESRCSKIRQPNAGGRRSGATRLSSRKWVDKTFEDFVRAKCIAGEADDLFRSNEKLGYDFSTSCRTLLMHKGKIGLPSAMRFA